MLIKFIFVVLSVFSGNVFASFSDQLIDNMGQNEATLMNAPNTDWAQHGYLDMGFAARGDATPSYWANAQGSRFTSSEPWTAIVPWFHVWPVEGNSGESRVKVSNINVQMLIDGNWQIIDMPTGQWGQLEPWNLIGGKGGIDQRSEGGGAFSYLINNSGPLHGGLGKYDLNDLGVDPTNIQGVAISAVAEIIEGNGNLLFEIGGDYYPNIGVSVERDYELGWGPAIGGSKFAKINGKRCLYMTTIDPPGTGDMSEYERNGGKVGLTYDELRENPPQDLCGFENSGGDNQGGESGGNTGGSGGNAGGNNSGGGSNGYDTVSGPRVVIVSKKIIRDINRLIDLYEGKQSDKIDGNAVIRDAEIVINKLEYLIGVYQ